MSICSFNKKRYPDCSLNKIKARLCAHGGQQTWGQYHWDTYAPLVTWASAHLLLVAAKIHNLDSNSINFVLAYPQADLPMPLCPRPRPPFLEFDLLVSEARVIVVSLLSPSLLPEAGDAVSVSGVVVFDSFYFFFSGYC